MSEHVITGLLKKRKELADQLAHHEKGRAQAKASLTALDTTLRLYMPEHDLPVQGSARATKRRNRFFDVGEAPQMLRDYFREQPDDATPSTNDVVHEMAIFKGLDYNAMPADKQQVFRKSVMKTLKRGVAGGWLIEYSRKEGVIHWQLV